MKGLKFVILTGLLSVVSAAQAQGLRAGIIGLDTSHAIAFTKALNAEPQAAEYAGVRVTVAYPKGSPDIESSTKRVPDYIQQVKAMGVEIVDSIDELLKKCDVVFLETNDGRPHFEQAMPVFKAGKRVFIDKPVAGSLTHCVALYEAAAHYKTPMFSASSLRYTKKTIEFGSGKHGPVVGAETYSPCALEPTHPDLFWYGIHGVESLFTLMGAECERVVRVSTPGTDVAVGTWKDGRVGSFRGNRESSTGYGGTVFFKKGVKQIDDYGGYGMLLEEIVKFFKTGVAPVSAEETIAIFAFMEAADESKRQGGIPIKLEDVLNKARAEAKTLVRE
ncbi:MAG: Gfo/Idh/MocA family oxidoreductase [Kiritimatiellae bacterium]|nr:Gfo/Idh/MocA family oxidoreductase [Kiritimatiellia bacterium]